MSYDIWLAADTGGREQPGNYTYNVDPMFAVALGHAPEHGVQNGYDLLIKDKPPALERFKGKKAKKCVKDLRRAVERMESTPDRYRELNPENGWGDYEGALDYLRRFLRACEEHPNAIVEMWL